MHKSEESAAHVTEASQWYSEKAEQHRKQCGEKSSDRLSKCFKTDVADLKEVAGLMNELLQPLSGLNRANEVVRMVKQREATQRAEFNTRGAALVRAGLDPQVVQEVHDQVFHPEVFQLR